MVIKDCALTGLSLSERNACLLGELPELLVGLRVAHSSATDEKRPLRALDDLCGLGNRILIGRASCKTVDPLLEEGDRIIIGLALNVLRDCDADSAGVRRVCEDPERAYHGAHQLLRTHDAVPISADRAEGVVRGDREIMCLLNLLKHWIRLAARIDIAGKNQDRDVVCRGSRRSGDHVCGTGAYR